MNSSKRRDELPRPQGVLHGLFDTVVVYKGVNGVAEVAGGLALLILHFGAIARWVNWLTRGELSEDPHDHLALLLQNWANHFGHEAQTFAGWYLLAHGIVKLSLAIFLYMEKRWAFPVAILLFGLLLAYSVHRLTYAWSWPLACFAALDVLTVLLIAREWKALAALSTRSQVKTGR